MFKYFNLVSISVNVKAKERVRLQSFDKYKGTGDPVPGAQIPSTDFAIALVTSIITSSLSSLLRGCGNL